MNNENENENENEIEYEIDFGYSTAIAGFVTALLLVIVMFATSGRV